MSSAKQSSGPVSPVLYAHRAVVLLQPPGTCRAFTRSGSVYPPLGLCQIAATVEAERVVVLDADGLGWDDTTTWAAINTIAPRAIGMTATTGTLELVERHAAVAAMRGIRVVVGGPQASLAPGSVLAACPSVDWVVVGEGELLFPELVRSCPSITCALLDRGSAA